jgi:hypothetical protein
MEPKKIRQYRCYTGHFGTGLYSLLDRPISTITILRDPFDRTVSHLKYAWLMPRGHKAGWVGSILGRLPVSLFLTLVLSKHSCYLQDLQTHYLGVDLDLNPLLSRPDRRDMALLHQETRASKEMNLVLECAKRCLDTMAVVGTVERFAESFLLICQHLKIKAPAEIPADNAIRSSISSRYRDTEFLPDWVVRRIEELTVYDQQLYTYGCSLLDQQLAASRPSV